MARNRTDVPDPFADEMAALYGMLAEALPLALQRLKIGGVSGLDQYAFWAAHMKLSHHIDVPIDEDDSEEVVAFRTMADDLTDFTEN